MWRGRNASAPGAVGSCVAALFVLALLQPPVADAGGPVQLFDRQTAAQLDHASSDWPKVRRSRSTGNGPRILIRAPEPRELADGPTLAVGSPVSLLVQFESSQAPVDMSSLAVTARKGVFSKSLTDVLLPYVRGNAVQVDQLAIPAGNFVVEIAVADTNGTRTTATYRLEVADHSEATTNPPP